MASSAPAQDAALLDNFQQKYNNLIDVMKKICERHATPDQPKTVYMQKGETLKTKKDVFLEKIKGFNSVCRHGNMTTRNVASIFIKYIKNSKPHMWWDIMHDMWLTQKDLTECISIEKNIYLPIGAIYKKCQDIDAAAAENDSIVDIDKMSTKIVYLRTLYELFAVAIQIKIDQGTVVDGQIVKFDEESIEYTAWTAKLNGALKCIRQCTMIIDGHDEESGDFLSMILDKIVPVDPSTGQKVSKREIMDIFKDKLHSDGDITKLIAVIPDLISGKSSRSEVVANMRNNKMLKQMLSSDQIDAFADTVAGMSDKFFKGGTDGKGDTNIDVNDFMSRMMGGGKSKKGGKGNTTTQSSTPSASTPPPAGASASTPSAPTASVPASTPSASSAPSASVPTTGEEESSAPQ